MVNQKVYVNLTAEDLRDFLEFWPRFTAETVETQQMLIEDKDKIFANETEGFSWCHLYELPIKDHLALLYGGFLEDEQILSFFKKFTSSPNQIAVLPEVLNDVNTYIDSWDNPTQEEKDVLYPIIGKIFSISLSAFHSMRCILYHGCFLNELIRRARTGDDKALFDAIRIDPTVMGCKSVIERISKAALLQDKRFFAKLKAALDGKMAKREQANFQKMRLIFEVLHEAGAARLSDAQLYKLFIEELNLWTATEGGGDNVKALRKFADTYMKKKSTT